MEGYLTASDTFVIVFWGLLHTVLVFRVGFLLGQGSVQYNHKLEKFSKIFGHPVSGARTVR